MFDAAAFEAPATKQAAALLADWGSAVPALVLLGAEESVAGLSFRNIARVAVMPVEDAGVADVIGAASLLVSSTALEQLVARAAGRRRGGVMDPSQVIIRPVVSEKSFVLAEAGKYTFRVHERAHKTQIRQAIENLFEVKVVEVRTSSVKSKPKRRGQTSGRTRQWKKAIVQVREGDTIPIFQGLEGAE